MRTEGGRLVPLALEGASVLDWDTSLAEDTPLGRAWLAQEPTSLPEPLGERRSPPSESSGTHTVLPLRMGSRTFGLVALETRQRPTLTRGGATTADTRQVGSAMRMVDETALRLETALLFGEVRSIATSEERRRLAREIHDGIAQELASLGYAVDELVAEASAGAQGQGRRHSDGRRPSQPAKRDHPHRR